MRILVIDDAAVARAAFARFAHLAGFEIVGEAADADAGFALAAQGRADAIVVDGRLPPDGAASLVARLRAAFPSIAIFVVAALEETALVRSARAAGASGAILRPCVPSQIERAFALHVSAQSERA